MKDGARDHDHRRTCQDGALHPAAAGLHRPRRLSVRLLHAGTDLLGSRSARRRARQGRRRDPGTDERKSLPLRRLSEHRRRDPAGHGRRTMNNFQYSRATRRRRRNPPAGRRSRRQAHCRRDQPARPDEGECRAALTADRHLPPPASRQSRRRPTAGCASAPWCRIRISPTIR